MLLRFFILLLLSAHVCVGDAVFMVDGGVIKGQIDTNEIEYIEVKTKYLGVIKVFKKDINKIEITEDNEALRDALEADKKFFNSNMIIWKHEKSLTGENRVVIPAVDKKDDWLWRTDFFANRQDGTKDSRWFSGTIEVKHEYDDLRISSYIYGERETSGGDVKKKNAKYVLDYEVQHDMNSRYAKTEIKTDEIKKLDYSASQALGYGYYFLKESEVELRLRTGIFVSQDKYYGEEATNPSGLDLGLYSFYTFDNLWKFVFDSNFKGDFNHGNNFSYEVESYVEIPIYSDKLWNLRLGMEYDYNNEVPEGTEKYYSQYYIRLSLGWFHF